MDPSEADLRPLLVDHPTSIGEPGLASPFQYVFVDRFEHARRADRHAFVIELTGDELPTLVETSHQLTLGHSDVVEECRADVVGRKQLHRLGFDPRSFHVDQKHREPAVLGSILIGTGRQPDIVRIARQTGKDLLTVDHKVVAIGVGPGLQGGEVGPRVGFRISDAKMEFAIEDLGQEEIFLFLGSFPVDRGPHRIDGEHRNGRTGPHGLVKEDELFDRRATLSTVLGWPANPEPTIRSHLPHDCAHCFANAMTFSQGDANVRSQELVIVGAQLHAQRLLFFVVTDVHRNPLRIPCSSLIVEHVPILTVLPAGVDPSKPADWTVLYTQTPNQGCQICARAKFQFRALVL